MSFCRVSLSVMPVLRAWRFQLRSPRPAVTRALRRELGACRWVWNRAVGEQRERRARGEKHAGYAEMCRWLTNWRNRPETAWLREGSASAQQQTLRRLDAAYRRFFEYLKQRKAGIYCQRVGPPLIKGCGHDVGLRYPNPSHLEFDGERGRVKLPKVGWLRLRMSRPVEGEFRNVSITREGDRWFASVQTSVADVAPSPDLVPTLGIDLGIANFAALSQRVDGRELVSPLDALRRQAKRLARYQRSVARKTKGSNNRRKAVDRLASLHRRIARQRRDWLHQLSTSIATEHSVVALEDLRVASLSKSARGSADKPGRNVKAKSRLNRAILDQGWSEFRRQLEYKLAWRGGRLILVEAAYTSRTCRICGFEDEGNRPRQDTFLCLACGHQEHADIHAAKVILARAIAPRTTAAGHAAAACGGVRKTNGRPRSSAAPSRQEPAQARSSACLPLPP